MKEVVSIGQKVKVKVVEIDEQGRTNLSMIGNNAPVVRDPNQHVQSDHPLSRQFRRERAQVRSGQDTRSPQRRFKKTHY